MKVSVVIPVYNAKESIGLCLNHILNQKKLPQEIIVVDNNSRDNSVQVIKDFMRRHANRNIVILHEPKQGPAAARNRGIKYASGDIIAFTDSDCLPQPDWIENAVRLFEKENIDGAGGISYADNPQGALGKLQAVGEIIINSMTQKEITHSYEAFFGMMLATRNAVFKRSVFEQMGGFDESISLASGEDTDITIRAVNAGFKIIAWHTQLVVRHLPRKKLKAFLKQAFQYRLILPFLFKKHFKDKGFIEIPGVGVKGFIFPARMVLTKDAWIIAVLAVIFLSFRQFILFGASVALVFLAFRSARYIWNTKERAGIKISAPELTGMVAIDLLKKLFFEFGKFYGAIRYRVFFI